MLGHYIDDKARCDGLFLVRCDHVAECILCKLLGSGHSLYFSKSDYLGKGSFKSSDV